MGVIKRLRNELATLASGIRLQRRLKEIRENPALTFSERIAARAAQTPDAPAIFYEDDVMTYRAYNARSDAYAHWLRSQGLAAGEVVALNMENRPDYLCAWLGIVRAGGTAALINTNQTGRVLAHSLNISGARRLILGAEMAHNHATCTGELEREMEVWAQGGAIQGMKDLDAALAEQPQEAFAADAAHTPAPTDVALYIYTSGTTGLPKAAKISHFRLLNMMGGFATISRAGPRDRVYIVLPLYHSAGGVCAVGMGLLSGGAVILRRRFSASAFWEDAVRYQATIFQYIGELCRYMLNAPPHPQEGAHAIRLAVGNGLRPEIWPKFQERFRIPKILEFYGATEGNVALMNFDGTVGAVGRIPGWAKKMSEVELVRFDTEREEVVRNAQGLCELCGDGETGEAVGKIITDDPERAATRFEGYADAAATQKKLLRDVCEKGDTWFRTGDLLRRDRQGYYYFVDRIGDTFRWKGENVATSEVAEAIATFPGVDEVNVYGVAVPGADGRAGMAAIVAPELDLAKFQTYLDGQLPAYARPVFLRLQEKIEITVTFKHRKVDLVKEGFDPEAIGEPLYFADPQAKAYVRLDAALYRRITGGEVRL